MSDLGAFRRGARLATLILLGKGPIAATHWGKKERIGHSTAKRDFVAVFDEIIEAGLGDEERVAAPLRDWVKRREIHRLHHDPQFSWMQHDPRFAHIYLSEN